MVLDDNERKVVCNVDTTELDYYLIHCGLEFHKIEHIKKEILPKMLDEVLDNTLEYASEWENLK